jgi:internalin A
MAELFLGTAITPAQLAEILTLARERGWTELAIWGGIALDGRITRHFSRAGRNEDRVFLLSEALTEFPSALAEITTLQSLELSNHRFDANGESWSRLGALTELQFLSVTRSNVSDRAITYLARAMPKLRHLSHLDIQRNHFDRAGALALADGLASLPALTHLVISDNYLDPKSLSDILEKIVKSPLRARLNHLNLSRVGLRERGAMEVAGLLGSMTGLTTLYLEGNELGPRGVNAILGSLAKGPLRDTLEIIGLAGVSAGRTLTEVIEGTNDARAILAAYERLDQDRTANKLRPMNEVKLLVVGNEAVGKTSLIRYLLHDKPRDPDEQKTPRVAIHEQIDAHRWSPQGSPITLNVWDFGGQEIMRGTHRFFLTQGSLYIIVLEDRRQDDRSVYEWLATVRQRGADSPIVVVINKSDGQDALRLDEAGLMREYPNIVKFMRTSCDDDQRSRRSIEDLRQLLMETIASDSRLAHIREPRPPAWLRVKAEIVKLARHAQIVLDDEFRQICEAWGRQHVPPNERIISSAEQRRVLGMLHDLGAVVAHGLTRTAPVSLRQITLLDPNWLTRAIYTILNSPLVRDQAGEFSRDDLDHILDPRDYPRERHEFIVDMMEHPDVGLAFELPGSSRRRHLIPEALPPNSPDYSDWPADSLRFRFDYALLPQPLLPRFIVQSHRNLTNQPTRWRTGVVLQAAGCKALVWGDIEAKQVHIAVAGSHGLRRSALHVVLDDLDEVHALYPEVKPKAMVPLPDQHDVAVEYEYLLELEREEGPDYSFKPAGGAKRKYQVRELLEGIRWRAHRPDSVLPHQPDPGKGAAEDAVAPPLSPPASSPAPPSPSTPVRSMSWTVVRSLLGAAAAIIAVAGALYLPGWQSKLLAGAAALGAVAPAAFSLLRWHRMAASGLFTSGGVLQVAVHASGGVSNHQGTFVGSAGLSGPSDIVSVALIVAGTIVFAVGEYFDRRAS